MSGRSFGHAPGPATTAGRATDVRTSEGFDELVRRDGELEALAAAATGTIATGRPSDVTVTELAGERRGYVTNDQRMARRDPRTPRQQEADDRARAHHERRALYEEQRIARALSLELAFAEACDRGDTAEMERIARLMRGEA